MFLGLSSQSVKLLTNPQYLNSYSYSLNNPINALDPDGRLPQLFNVLNSGVRNIFNIGTALVPIVSDLRDGLEVMTGRNIITGQHLTADQRTLTESVLFVPIVSGSLARGLDDVTGGGLSVGSRAVNSLPNIATEIANGHAFQKHVVERGEFRGISTVDQFRDHIQNVMTNPTDIRELNRGRTGYWHADSGTVIVHNPRSADGGSAFVPEAGADYFYNVLE